MVRERGSCHTALHPPISLSFLTPPVCHLYLRMCVRVCVCVRVRACTRVCARSCAMRLCTVRAPVHVCHACVHVYGRACAMCFCVRAHSCACCVCAHLCACVCVCMLCARAHSCACVRVLVRACCVHAHSCALDGLGFFAVAPSDRPSPTALPYNAPIYEKKPHSPQTYARACVRRYKDRIGWKTRTQPPIIGIYWGNLV